MTVINGYEQSDREQKLDILNLPSLEEQAKAIIPTGGFGYIVGGARITGRCARTPRRLRMRKSCPRRCRTLRIQT